MNILIIGNGFDIAHGLPTKYRDFLRVCETAKIAEVFWVDGKPSDSIRGLNKLQSEEIKDICSTMGYDIWSEFVELISENNWIEYFQFRKAVIGEDWIDLEQEIKNILEMVYEYMEQSKDEKINKDIVYDTKIKKICEQYIDQEESITYRKLFEHLLSENKKLIRALELYMDGFINRKGVEKIPYIAKKTIDRVLSFNYTNTYAGRYDFKTECCYLHGKANVTRKGKDCNLVLGFDDHYLEEEKVKPELIPFEKYYQRIVNRTGNQYLDWLEKMNNDSKNNIYIYGHSLGLSDGDVLRTFILHKKVRVFIYYYDELDRAHKIRNLALILGPDNLIKLTGGISPVIQFETVVRE